MSIKELATTVDERLYELYDAKFGITTDLENAQNGIRFLAKQKREYINYKHKWVGTFEEALETLKTSSDYRAEKALTEYERIIESLQAITTETQELAAVYREYQWTRAFLVLNSNGHIHSSFDCSTCFPTTRYEWLTQYSADPESEIVALAGETACTVCYPSAPAEILNRPATIQSKARAEKEKAATARAEAKAAREAKKKASAPTASGEYLRVPSRWAGGRDEEIKTERTAITYWNECQRGIEWERECGRSDKSADKITAQGIIEQALAGKHNVSASEKRDELLGRYKKRK